MKRTIIFAVFIVSILPTEAQLLWKISGNGLKKDSYLFVSHPLIPVAFLDSVPGLYKAYNSCGTVISEININTIDASAKLHRAASIPDNKTVADYVSVDTFNLVDKELRELLKIGLKEMSAMRPEIILDFYKAELFKQLTGVSDDAQSDSYFQMAAVEMGKKVIGLEDIDKHVSTLTNHKSIKDETKILVSNVLRKDSLSKELLNLSRLYRKGKINDLHLLLQPHTNNAEQSNNNTDMISNRVSDWLKKLPPVIYNKSCFITVDLKYAAGSNGLIEGLQKAGFKVKAVEKL